MYTEDQRRDHIRELQEYLRALSTTDERYPLLGVDGQFGPETTEAIRVFQQTTNSPVTGTVQRADWERIVREYGNLLLQIVPARMIAPFPYPTFVLRPGDRDPLVYILQVMLGAISGVPLAVTGIYDTATENAVREQQLAADLLPTGEVDRITWDYLAALYNDR
ncbi:MAG: peptidoglycan-binding protein [Clostridia bacterium]|nr:peptidoglycan-binding protein [Clostridia bacterium]